MTILQETQDFKRQRFHVSIYIAAIQIVYFWLSGVNTEYHRTVTIL